MLASVIGIPILGGVTEGGLIVIGICAIILAALVLMILVIYKYGNDIRKTVNAAKDQVANSHDINLRDDIDAKHDTIFELVSNRFDRMNDRITSVDRRLTGIDVRINRLENKHESSE